MTGVAPLKKPRRWTKLDTAAKLFPPTRTKRDTKVFRFACELFETVDYHVLELAIERTLPLFPSYRSVMKKGLFWYYLEDSSMEPCVKEEHRPPLSQVYNGNCENLLFEVTYYKCRINLEVFHVLSDGAGAIQFFRVLVGNYLIEKYERDNPELIQAIESDASIDQGGSDSFAKYYEKTSLLSKREKTSAYQLRGEYIPQQGLSVIEGFVSTTKLHQKAEECGASITQLLTATFIMAIGEQMGIQDMKKPVVITVPVNLRKFFPSESVRNFFQVINVTHDFGGGLTGFDEVLKQVISSFKEQLTLEKIRDRMNRYTTLEHVMVARLVPLALKNPVIRFGNWIAKREITASFSNVGKIAMPEPLEKYIYMIDVFDSTDRLQAVMSSFGDKFVTSFTSVYAATDIQMNYFRRLSNMGLKVTVTSNQMS